MRISEIWMPPGREQVPWATMAAILVIARLCEPSSKLHIAEAWYRRTALDDVLGVPPAAVNDDCLYRALDRLLERNARAARRYRIGSEFACPSGFEHRAS